MFADVRDAVASLIDPARIRWIGFSHIESDECGAMKEWLEVATQAQPLCSVVGAAIGRDFLFRPPRGMQHGDVLTTGRFRFRFCRTPQLPHGWDAGLLFEETNRTLLCSDLFHQNGNVEPLTESDIIGRAEDALREYQAGILADYVPYTARTDRLIEALSELDPRTLAAMHGSVFAGDGASALKELALVRRRVYGQAEL